MNAGRILLLACYELGHQPLSLAWPLTVLQEAGFPAEGRDLSIEAFPEEAVVQASFVGIAVPMHTALRLGVEAAARVRTLNPQAHLCFYGLYAWLNADYLLGDDDLAGRPLADSVIAGEYEAPLLALVQALAAGGDASAVPGVTTLAGRGHPHLERLALPMPNRAALPALDQYAHFVHGGRHVAAGYVEASRGCLHTCRHCPIVPVYGGRFFVVPAETVLADIRQQVAAGAGHITFGDPDFLNGPGHVLKIARALHAEFPEVTFDFTTKVEHILEKRHVFPELRRLGAAFVVSAFESLSDEVLARLEKGHTAADLDLALEILEAADLPVQPTWVAFTPWTTLDDYLAMLAWIRTRGLIPHVPAVQLALRLLVPPGSALLTEIGDWRLEMNQSLISNLQSPISLFGPLESANFGYAWRHPDACMDQLQEQVATVAQAAANNPQADPYQTFAAVERLAYQVAGRPAPAWSPPARPAAPPPRLTEDWFC
ncbi:MAG: CUAEP/CCAEP-tail radical SAM protein [Chloroflexi bacterium]|nr:CUAEP/CCAEP-tail radical SAM protein [Chloroflexota bacterium]MCI0580279.1 CUAEP/CCAEP-tail radical SAM protein [Chloroflexota bacterium]MCI0643690.1 CUAEP/CCAEP-tail radical SAM protein [Chloroflexota bacterium]MCI0729074.1 CUAEP/CCAEP-tail radical SAM protein [Chloroflexota bacterium]